jgi:hypothetical protein
MPTAVIAAKAAVRQISPRQDHHAVLEIEIEPLDKSFGYFLNSN